LGIDVVPIVITVVSFLVATVTAVAAGAIVRRLAPAYGAVVPPRPDRWHCAPTPTLGGIAIVVATLIGFGVGLAGPLLGADVVEWSAVLIAGLAMFVVGLFDDRLQLSPVAKLVASLAVGAFLVFALAGIEPAGALPTSYTLIGTVWFAGLCHAFNLLDNMDGLAAGVALIAAAFLAVLLGPWFGFGLSTLLVALVGALAGFLYWNRPRARLFMGDCGSLFIGAILGGVSLVPVFHARIAFISPTVLATLILVVPLFDTAFVLVLRRLAGRSATRGGTDHVSHRLVSLGFSERSAVRILYLLGLIGGLTAWVLVTGNTVEPLLVVAPFGVLVILTGIYLARVPAYNAEDFKALQKSSFAPFLKDLAFKWHVGEVLLDLVLITVCYYAAFRLRFEGDEFDNFRPYFTSSLPLILGIKIAALYGSGLYRRSWETFGFRDLASVARGVGMGSLLTVAVAYYLYRGEGSSRVVLVLDGLLLALTIFATRASFRTMNLVASARNRRHRRVLVYGAGGYGRLLVREMRANPAWKMNPVGFIDDDPMKAHRWIVGVPVRGSIEQLEQTMRRYSVDEVVLSSPAINGKVEHHIKEVCTRLQRPVRRLEMKIT
jgi:UDP-GlcNAc:undecaprenyl-phosphate/decaprenyl-phosphate GlcNAc-1-phosphate transferase